MLRFAMPLFFFSKDKKKLSSEQLFINLNKIITHKNNLISDLNENGQVRTVSSEKRKLLIKQKQDELVSSFKKSGQGRNNIQNNTNNGIAEVVVMEE